jgi:hypothetical protein
MSRHLNDEAITAHNVDTIARWVGEATDGVLTYEWYGESRYGLSNGRLFKPGGVWLGVEEGISRMHPIVGVAASITIPYRKLDGRFRTVKTEVATAVRFAIRTLDHLGDEALAFDLWCALDRWARREGVNP